MKLLNRVYVNLTDDQLAGLKARAQRNGSAVAEEIRRAVAVSLTSEGQCAELELMRLAAAGIENFTQFARQPEREES